MRLLDRLEIRGTRISARAGRGISRFVTAELYAEYDADVPLADLPAAIAVLPFLWNLAPVVWASGETCEVDVLDERVVEALEQIRGVVHSMYPASPLAGRIVARSTTHVEALPSRGLTRALLFSGGIDSIHAALTLAGPELLLVSVWGADVPTGDTRGWRATEAANREFAAAHAGGLATVRSNIRALNYPRLESLAADIRAWWPDVQFSMALAGVTAPLLYARGIPTLHIASGHSVIERSHASMPRLDNRISLATAHVHHAAAAVTRQPKVRYIVERFGAVGVPLRVCYSNPARRDQNCGRCTKCARTMAGLVVAGGDPRAYGFPGYSPRLLAELPSRLASGALHFGPFEAVLWKDIQANLPAESADPFSSWLRAFDFEAYLARQRAHARGTRLRRVARRLARHAPRAYEALRAVQRRAAAAARRRPPQHGG